MESSQVLKDILSEYGFKRAAAEMKLTRSLLYKWCQPRDADEDARAENPLERVLQLVKLTGNPQPLHWLCQQCDGFYVSNPMPANAPSSPVLLATQQLLREFSELLQAVSESYTTDSAISPEEAARIRSEWEQLKTAAERFVVGCERGLYEGAS